jgi:hypothetical protein
VCYGYLFCLVLLFSYCILELFRQCYYVFPFVAFTIFRLYLVNTMPGESTSCQESQCHARRANTMPGEPILCDALHFNGKIQFMIQYIPSIFIPLYVMI